MKNVLRDIATSCKEDKLFTLLVVGTNIIICTLAWIMHT